MKTLFGKSFNAALMGAGLLMAGQTVSAAIITFDQTNVIVGQGDSFTLTLVGQEFAAGVNGATADGTLGGGVTIAWDPSRITLGALTDVSILFPGDEFFAPDPVLDSAAGTLSLSVASFEGTDLTAFDIASMSFTGLAPGSTPVDITLSPIDVWSDGVGAVDVAPTTVDGMVTVTGNGGPGPVIPIPAAVWLFGSGLVGLIGAAVRRTNGRAA